MHQEAIYGTSNNVREGVILALGYPASTYLKN